MITWIKRILGLNETSYKLSEVFVPGGDPKLTYNPRSDKKIEEKVKRASENLSKLLMVTGPTKSGKTVVTNKIFSRDTSIWFDCGTYEKEDDLWEYILDELDGYTSLQKSTHKTESRSASGKIISESFLRNEIGGKVEVQDEDGSIKGRSISAKNKAINILRNSKVPLVLDDFHYLPSGLSKLKIGVGKDG